jgi:hypothetical protein
MIFIIIYMSLIGPLVLLGITHFNENAGLYTLRNKWVKLINDAFKLDIPTYERDEVIRFLRSQIADLQRMNTKLHGFFISILLLGSPA